MKTMSVYHVYDDDGTACEAVQWNGKESEVVSITSIIGKTNDVSWARPTGDELRIRSGRVPLRGWVVLCNNTIEVYDNEAFRARFIFRDTSN